MVKVQVKRKSYVMWYVELKWVRVETPSLKASRLSDMAIWVGRLFHCTIVLGMKLCCMYSLVSAGMKKASGWVCLEIRVWGTSSLGMHRLSVL